MPTDFELAVLEELEEEYEKAPLLELLMDEMRCYREGLHRSTISLNQLCIRALRKAIEKKLV